LCGARILPTRTLVQQFSESLHLASAAVSEEAGAVGVPLFEVAKANPMGIAAVHADVDRALFGASVIAAVVIFHKYGIGAVAHRKQPP
jgi:hypothetical protein